LRFRNQEFRSPLQSKTLATRVFHFDCNATAPAILDLDIHSSVKEFIPGVLRHNRCAVEEIHAPKVFDRRCCHSAPMLFHYPVPAFPLVVADDHLIRELK
jgi:hypothetical protein